MKIQNHKNQKGFTLIEMAIVIAIITLLALGIAQSATYFRAQANRSLCVVTQKQLQDAMRSYANFNNLNEGGGCTSTDLIGSGLAFEVAPTCPTDAVPYKIGTTVPVVGTIYAPCANNAGAPLNHTPNATQVATW